METTDKTCCFTGHRAVPKKELESLRKKLNDTILALIREGFFQFRAGGARGFDILAAEAVIDARKVHPQVELTLLLPCRDQAEKWNQTDRQRYEWVKEQADGVLYVSEFYVPGCMHKRNRALVDGSCVCVAYCTRTTGGTAYTVNYARQQGLQVIFLNAE